MSKIEVGDIVRKKIGQNFSLLGPEGKVARIEKGSTGNRIYLEDVGYYVPEDSLELVEKKMKKYKLETELDLQEILQLRCLTGQLNNMTGLYEETRGICREVLDDPAPPEYVNGFHLKFQKECEELVKRATRKTVTIGNKEYYEDELQTALANIKPL